MSDDADYMKDSDQALVPVDADGAHTFQLQAHDVRVEPMSYDECTIESLRSQLTDAIARARAAEGMILAIESNAGFYRELADKWKERARAAETRLAERDASFNRLRWRP